MNLSDNQLMLLMKIFGEWDYWRMFYDSSVVSEEEENLFMKMYEMMRDDLMSRRHLWDDECK